MSCILVVLFPNVQEDREPGEVVGLSSRAEAYPDKSTVALAKFLCSSASILAS